MKRWVGLLAEISAQLETEISDARQPYFSYKHNNNFKQGMSQANPVKWASQELFSIV